MYNKPLFLKSPGKYFIILVLALFGSITGFTQTSRQITGNVTDEKNEPLPNVSVIVKGTSNGTTTDSKGNYSIIFPKGSTALIFSFIGLESQEIRVEKGNVINTSLKSGASALKDVVVIGYGTQSRRDVTTSISKLDNKVLENVPYANAASALQGTLAGVRVQSGNGQPGATPTVVVRGGTSINNPEGATPLYIIDGVIRPQMDNISSEDIESIQVLKDAASTAIYGARGSNGVVIITTKSGKPGQARVSYNYDLTYSNVGKKFDMANARDYITASRLGVFNPPAPKFVDATSRLRLPNAFGTGNDLTNNTAFTVQYLTPDNKYKLDEGWQSMPDPVDPSKTLIFDDTNFQDLMYQTGVSNNHHIDVSGGTDMATFNAGIGYLDNQGTVITTGYQRLSFNLNGTLKVKDNLSFFGRLLYSNSKQNNPGTGYDVTFYRSAGLPNTAKYEFEDGTLAPGINSGIGNPVYYLTKFINRNRTDNLTMSLGSHWDILSGLSFDPQVSMYNVNTDAYSFAPGYWNGPLSFVNSRNAGASNYRWRQIQADAVFNYNKSFSKVHHLVVTAGFSYFGREEDQFSATGKGASTDLIPTLNASSVPLSVSSSISNQVLLGYFSRVNYNYKEKYLFSLNARYDGSSNLGAANQWGFFPGLSVGWNLHKENFWKTLSGEFSTFKIRSSYGVNGNISGLSDFQAQGAYNAGSTYDGNAAIQNSTMANPGLKWESSKTFDVGADLGFFNNRINLIVDYYKRITDNLITSIALPPSTGFGSSLANLGSLQNLGFEIEVSARVLPVSSAFQWNVSFNAAKVKSKILRLPSNGTENNRIGGVYVWDPKAGKGGSYVWRGGLQEGGTIGDMYTLKQVGIYATDQEAQSAPVDMYIASADRTVFGGDTKWLDRDRNDTIDSRDQVYMGNTYPVWTGGFSSTISYKNFSLYVRMDFTLGHTIFDYARMFMETDLYGGGNVTQTKLDNSWKKEGDIAQMSRYYWGGERIQRNNFLGVTSQGNSIYYESGDFLCVRELTLSYSMPAEFLRKLKINNLRFNITGNNLHYFTNYTGLNPEVGGKDNGRYPIPKNITFGASIVF